MMTMVCYQYLNDGDWLGHPYYTPEVLVSILKPDGSGQVNFIMEVDSGAAISLLPSGAATMLGLDLESGTRVDLGGVGGAVFSCYVHTCDVVIGEKSLRIPIAFGTTPDFPPLLGRLGLYDQADIFMDNMTEKATCIGQVGDVLSAPNAFTWPWDVNAWLYPILLVGGLFAVVMLVK